MYVGIINIIVTLQNLKRLQTVGKYIVKSLHYQDYITEILQAVWMYGISDRKTFHFLYQGDHRIQLGAGILRSWRGHHATGNHTVLKARYSEIYFALLNDNN